MELVAKAVSHADVKGKIQQYIKITNGVSAVFINVGKNTYDAVCELNTSSEELPSETTDKGNNMEAGASEKGKEEKENEGTETKAGSSKRGRRDGGVFE
ncbi:hypothetical protein [Flyfo microvirus Tbat2_116]|nr:hypothetical protein [Flyfo microvirus Tbat2_116]